VGFETGATADFNAILADACGPARTMTIYPVTRTRGADSRDTFTYGTGVNVTAHLVRRSDKQPSRTVKIEGIDNRYELIAYVDKTTTASVNDKVILGGKTCYVVAKRDNHVWLELFLNFTNNMNMGGP
jgi:hypothetical protein